MNKKIVHDALVLMAFSLILGGILGAVYQITLPAITQAEYEKTQEAYMAVFADAESFEELEFDKAAAAEMMAAKGFKDSIDNVQKAIVGGEVGGGVIGGRYPKDVRNEYLFTVVGGDVILAVKGEEGGGGANEVLAAIVDDNIGG